jgi:hypothetical protein
VTSFATEMHVTGLKIDAKNETAPSANGARKGTVISMGPSTTSPTGNVPQTEDTMRGGGVKAFSPNLKRVNWPVNFKPSGIGKYDGSTNLAEWLEVYQLVIEAAGGDSYVMVNYLPVCLSSSAKMWLLRLPTGSIRSWSHLCRMFNSNFQATCARPGVKWDLANMVQKKGESLREFIQRFCNKRNVIPEAADKSIIMFFKKGLSDSSLTCKLAMKNPRTSEEILVIANKYALAEEAALNTKSRRRKGVRPLGSA